MSKTAGSAGILAYGAMMGISLSAGAIIALFSLLSAFSAIALMAALTRDPRRPPSVAGGRVFFMFHDHELADASPAALAVLREDASPVGRSVKITVSGETGTFDFT